MHHYRWLLVLRPRPYFRASGQRTTYAPPSDQWSIAWTPIGVSKAKLRTRLNRRFSRLMLCSPRIKGSWLYLGCSTWVPRSTALTISSSSSGDWTYPSALIKMQGRRTEKRRLLHHRYRRQYVRYNGRTSEISVVECGVPQGSVLGPLYFVFFTADVFGIADKHGFAIHGYADDMQIYDHCVVDDMHHLASRLVDCIGRSIGIWMTNNRLKLSASRKPNSSDLVRLIVWPGVRSSRSWSTGPLFFHPRQSAT